MINGDWLASWLCIPLQGCQTWKRSLQVKKLLICLRKTEWSNKSFSRSLHTVIQGGWGEACWFRPGLWRLLKPSDRLVDEHEQWTTYWVRWNDCVIGTSTCLPGLSTEMAGTPEFLAPEVPCNNFLSLLSLCCLILDNFNLKCCS